MYWQSTVKTCPNAHSSLTNFSQVHYKLSKTRRITSVTFKTHYITSSLLSFIETYLQSRYIIVHVFIYITHPSCYSNHLSFVYQSLLHIVPNFSKRHVAPFMLNLVKKN